MQRLSHEFKCFLIYQLVIIALSNYFIIAGNKDTYLLCIVLCYVFWWFILLIPYIQAIFAAAFSQHCRQSAKCIDQ